MIHFYEDWDYYENADIQVNTTNTSFLRYVDVLQKGGVKNHLWPLAVLNKEVLDIDPFDPNITPREADLVTKEAMSNYMYYIREIARLGSPGAPKPMQFMAHRGNMAFSWIHHLNIDANCTLPRQSGKSVGADSNNNWHVNLEGRNLKVQLYTKDNKLRSENVLKLKAMREFLPPYMNFFDDKIDSDNNAEVTCKKLNNKYMTAVAQKTEDGAENTGRGLTSQHVQIDEFPYCYNCRISVPAMIGSMTSAVDNAKKNGASYGIQITTTAGKKDTADGSFAYDFIHGGIDWREQLLDCENKEDLIDTIVRNRRGKKIIVNVTLNHRQLGKTDEWVMEKIRASGSDKEQAERDYLNHWTSGGVYSPLSTTLNNVIRNAIRTPKFIEKTKNNYLVNWHFDREDLEEVLDNEYTIASLDSSNAVGGDGNGLVFQTGRDMNVIGGCNVNTTSLYNYAIWIAMVLIRFPKMTLIVENKSSGQAIMDTIAAILIKNGFNPFERMYNTIVQNGTGECKRFAEVKNIFKGVCPQDLYEKYKKYFGFQTTGQSRDYLYNSVFRTAATSCGHLVKDKDLAEQILALEVKNQRIDHPKGGNDDMVIAWNLGHYFTIDGKNLWYYGIPDNYVRSAVSNQGAIMTPDEIRKLREQSTLKAKVEELKEELKKANDSFQRGVIELRIQKLLDNIDDNDTVWTMDSIRNECKPKTNKTHVQIRKFGYC